MTGARNPIATSSLFRSEAEVLARFDGGQSKAQILAETGYCRRVVDQAISYTSETSTAAMYEDCRRGSRALIAAISREFPERVALP